MKIRWSPKKGLRRNPKTFSGRYHKFKRFFRPKTATFSSQKNTVEGKKQIRGAKKKIALHCPPAPPLATRLRGTMQKKKAKPIKIRVIGGDFILLYFQTSKTKFLLPCSRRTQDYQFKITKKACYILYPISFRGVSCPFHFFHIKKN